jgi:hypothetical protein
MEYTSAKDAKNGKKVAIGESRTLILVFPLPIDLISLFLTDVMEIRFRMIFFSFHSMDLSN